MSDLNVDSTELLIGANRPQGHVFYSQYYKSYIMFGTHLSYVDAIISNTPWGPWSEPVTIYTPSSMKNYIYAANVQEKFVDPSGRWFLLSYTDDNTLPVVNIVSIFLLACR